MQEEEKPDGDERKESPTGFMMEANQEMGKGWPIHNKREIAEVGNPPKIRSSLKRSSFSGPLESENWERMHNGSAMEHKERTKLLKSELIEREQGAPSSRLTSTGAMGECCREIAFTDVPILSFPDPSSTATYFHFFPSTSSRQTTLNASGFPSSPSSLPGKNLSSASLTFSGSVVRGGVESGGAEASVAAAVTRMVSRTRIRASWAAGRARVCADAGEFLNRMGAIN